MAEETMPAKRFAAAAALCLMALACPAASGADWLSSRGPVLIGGQASKNGTDLWLAGLGWRFGGGLGSRVETFADRFGLNARLVVEPSVAAILGDAESVEAQVVPMIHLRPTSEATSRWSPYVEGGVGLAYTAVHGLRLGSELQFSDQIGAGIVLPPWRGRRISVGYRFRHLSHAGLWAKTNSGLNTQFLVITFE